MNNRRIQLGKEGEDIIEAALRKQHYTIKARNWRCAAGEVDIVAIRDAEYYFVEVRTRHGPQSVSPEQGLTIRKRERMEKTARSYLGQHAGTGDIAWHLSFAAVVLNQSGSIVRMSLYPDLDGEALELI